jgi:hypothetical protein
MPSGLDHFMIDIETYDVTPSAVILSIGAERILGSGTFYVEIDPNTQYERTASLATKEWWAKQGNPPIHGTTTLHDALTSLAHWLKSLSEEPIIWCKGTDFDTVILAHAYKQLNLEVPWKYYNVRDCRTVFKLCNAPKVGAEHNALEDAMAQSDELIRCLSKLNVELA